jgi:hypothetical protein
MAPYNLLFGSAALHSPGEGGGEYNHIVDALLTPPMHTHKDVWQHEASHRISVVFGTAGSGFSVTRALAGISHVLIWVISRVAVEYGVTIEGSRLEDLRVGEASRPLPHAVGELLDTLLSRLWQCEAWYRMGWNALAPLAELAAIDFAEGVRPAGRQSLLVPNRAVWRLRRKTDISPAERQSADAEKARLVDHVAAHYPPEFGGYHIGYGTFQNALRKAWQAYDLIPADEVREELLHLCMACLYMESDGRILTREPLAQIFAHATFAREDPAAALLAFQAARIKLELKGQDFVRHARRLLDGLPGDNSLIEGLVHEVEALIRRQQQVRPWDLGGPDGFYWAMENEFDNSFLRFDATAIPGQVRVSPAFLECAAAGQNPGLIANLPRDWWRTLLLLESMRQGILNGTPLTCPLQGYEVTSFEHDADVQCWTECIFRHWAETKKWRSQADTASSLCRIPPAG